MISIKDLANAPERFVSGHRSCAGCGFPMIIRTVLAAAKCPVVVCAATGCLEVTSTIYPFTSWNTPFIHSAFENASATMTGITRAYAAMKKREKIKGNAKFVIFGGDGGTYDIGLQSLSGALERKENFVYVCYDNEAYMNTGIQRSSATPKGAYTTTTPSGKPEFRKDLAKICIAHNIEYVATASPHNFIDLALKAEKAFNAKGPSVLIVLSPCPLGWGSKTDQSIAIAKLAVESNFWPIYEYDKKKYTLNFESESRKPVEKFFETQSRFKHLLAPENNELLKEIQSNIDERFDELKKLCKNE
jgi:pyruvate ferredoxin oxidoreductase beta subunit